MKKFSACLLILLLTGCASLKEAVFGRETPLAPLSWAALGTTTREDILRKLGPPEEIDGRRFDALEADVFFYYEADAGERPAYRFLACEFSKGVLAAYAYHGSDEAEFDEGRLPQLVKGQSTRQTVESRLGAPAGKARLPTTITLPALGLRLGGAPFPLAEPPGAAAEVWQYHSHSFDQALRKTTQKTLSVFFDAGGLYVGGSLLREQAGKF